MPLAKKHGMVVTHTTSYPVLRGLVYSNGKNVVTFDLDVRDMYVQSRYGASSSLSGTGNVKGDEFEAFGVVNKLLNLEGVEVPQGFDQLIKKKRLQEAVQILVEGIERHESEIFGKEKRG